MTPYLTGLTIQQGPDSFHCYGDPIYGSGAVEQSGNSDAALWASPDGRTWQRLNVDGLGGPGSQLVTDAVAVGNSLVLAGFDRDAPVTWTVTPA